MVFKILSEKCKSVYKYFNQRFAGIFLDFFKMDLINSHQEIKKIIFEELNEETTESSAQRTMLFFDGIHPNSFNHIICKVIYSSFVAQQREANLLD